MYKQKIFRQAQFFFQNLSAMKKERNYKVKIYSMKLISSVLLLVLLQISICGTLVNKPSVDFAYSGAVPVSRSAALTCNQVAEQVDLYIRAQYRQYLVRASLCYLASVNTKTGFLFFHLYKNVVGTFLSISSYTSSTGGICINTLVRVGQGCSDERDIPNAISVTPFVISVDLGQGQYSVAHENEENDYDWRESSARRRWFKKADDEERTRKSCDVVEQYIKKQYWYYLTPDTKRIDNSYSNIGTSCNCVFTFINYVGLFLVVGQWDYQTSAPLVHTFVRLGDGSNPNEVTKCKIYPSIS